MKFSSDLGKKSTAAKISKKNGAATPRSVSTRRQQSSESWWKLHRELLVFFSIIGVLLLSIVSLWIVVGRTVNLPGIRILVPRGKKVSQEDLALSSKPSTALEVQEMREGASIAERQAAIDNAVKLYAMGDLGKAEKQYQILIEVFPQNARFFNDFGNVLRDHGKKDQARTMYEKAIELDPSFLLSTLNLAYLLVDQGKTGDAGTVVKRGLENHPDSKELKAFSL